MGSPYWLSRLDAPFGSVRFSNLRDVVVTDKAANSQEVIKPNKLGRYDISKNHLGGS